MAKREMNAVSGRMTLKKISLASASVFSTVLVIRVAAYLQSEIMFKVITVFVEYIGCLLC